jgi:hypothetical protein
LQLSWEDTSESAALAGTCKTDADTTVSEVAISPPCDKDLNVVSGKPLSTSSWDEGRDKKGSWESN